MKILFIVDGLGAGGAGRVVSRLANKMSEKGYNVGILTFFSNKVEYRINDNIDYFTFVGADGKNTDSYPKRIKRIQELCINNKIELVISFLTEINVYSILAGVGRPWATIISERNNPYVEPKDNRVRFLRNIFYRFADGFVFQTEDAKNYFSKRIKKRGIVIPNPITEDIPDPFYGERRKRIVSVGRLTPQKNYKMAIEAFEKISDIIPDYVYEIYGDGPEKGSLNKLIEEKMMDKRIILRGHHKDVLDQIRDASLFVMSSDYEGMPNALMEAMAVGLPVISTNHPIGGAAMLIKNEENGLLVPVNNSTELANKILTMITDRAGRECMAKKAINIRSEYHIDKICSMWENYIQHICSCKNIED